MQRTAGEWPAATGEFPPVRSLYGADLKNLAR